MESGLQQRAGDILSRGDGKYLLFLIVVGIFTRVLFFSQTYVVSWDSVCQYIPVAQLFAWGDYGRAINQPQLPLYPFVTALVSKVTGNVEVAGQLVSIAASTLAVVPLFLVGRSIFNRAAALWAGIFYLFSPEMLQRSADVLKEGLWIFLLFSAVFLFHLFLKRPKIVWLTAAVLAALLGTLTRVISLVLILLFITWVSVPKTIPHVSARRRLAYVTLIVTMCAVLILPIMINVKAVTGQWDISKKTMTVRSLVESIILDKWPLEDESRELLPLAGKIVKVCNPMLFVLVLLGLMRRKVIPRNLHGESFLMSVVLAYMSVIGVIMWSTQRYLFFPILLSYLWAGVGFVEIQESVRKWFRLPPERVVVGASVCVLLFFLPVLFNPYRTERLGIKVIGTWIRERETGIPVVLTDDPRVAYYARGDCVLVNRQNYEESVRNAAGDSHAYVVVKSIELREYPSLRDLATREFHSKVVPGLSDKERKKYVVFSTAAPENK